MESLVVRFAHYLRQNDFLIPTSVIEDAVQLFPYLNMADRFSFEESIRQVWIKDYDLFDKYRICFKEFFYNQVSDLLAELEKGKMEEKQQQIQKQSIEKAEKREKKYSSSNEWILDNLNEPKTTSEKLFYHTAKSEWNEIAAYNGKQLEHVKPADVHELMEELIWSAILQKQPKVIFDSIHATGKMLLSMRTDLLKVKTISHEYMTSSEKTMHKGMRQVIKTEIDQLKERDLKTLKEADIRKLKDHIQRTSAYFLTKIGALLRSTRKIDEIDMDKTIHSSLQTYGVPMEIHYRKPKVMKTKIDLILDVSGSVIQSAEFLSLFAYLIHKQFPNQVRVFVFVGLLAEVTHFYQLDDSNMAIDYSLRKAAIDYKGYSNYDKALSIFEEQFLEEVDQQSIVMFLGDARNNKNSPRVDMMEKLAQRAKTILWFNPEERKKWDTGDSVIGKYRPHCQGVYETTSFHQLESSLLQTIEALS